MGAWKLIAEVGSLTITETRDTHGAPLPRVRAARWVDELAEGEAWPPVQAPSTGTLELVMADAAAAAAITPTTPVRLRVFTPPTAATPSATFHGRVADPVITPHDQGVLVTLQLTDYLADLAGHTVGGVFYGAQKVQYRLKRVMAEHGYPNPLDWAEPAGALQTQFPEVVDRQPAPVSLLEYVQELLSWTVRDEANLVGGNYQHNLYQYELRPNITAAGTLHTTDPWVEVLLDNSTPTYPVVGSLVLSGGTWDAALDDGKTLSATWLEFTSRWSRRRGAAVNTVTVVQANGEHVTATNRPAGTPKVTHRRETQLGPPVGTMDPALNLALFLIGVANGWGPLTRGTATDGGYSVPVAGTPAPSWEADEFTAHIDLAPDGWWPGPLRASRLVSDLPTRHHPENTDRWAGVITGLETHLEDGRCVVGVRLAARPMTAAPAAVTWDTLPATMTWDTTGPATTWRDLAYVS